MVLLIPDPQIVVNLELLIESLEMLIRINEDDFDRGKGKYILREFIDELKTR